MQKVLPVLWPKDLSCEVGGYCIGWTRPVICVAGVLYVDSRNDAESILSSVQLSDESAQLSCGSSPRVIGRFTGLDVKRRLVIELHDSEATTLQVIFYQRPNLRYMEIYALDFHIYDFATPKSRARYPTKSPLAFIMHDFTSPTVTPSSLGPEVLNQMNLGAFLDQSLRRRVHLTPHRNVWLYFASLQRSSHRIVAKVFQTTLLFTNWGDGNLVNGTIAHNAVAQQVDVRVEQIVSIPSQSRRIYNAAGPPTSHSISRYVNFWNEIWLILNDIIIGSALGSFLCENSETLSSLLHSKLEYSLIDLPQHALIWLNNWPAGLKLNTELSRFYCHSLLGIVAVWGEVLRWIIFPHLPSIIYAIGLLGSLGLTMSVSALSDLLGIVTLHLHICYIMSAAVFSQQLTISGSLWNLFRGKRYNVLRKRKDSWDYDVDQLVLGTILFTLVAFLSPTIITYYALFALARLIIVLFHAGLDTILVLMNHFPLFALLLRIKSPLRMPGGFTFRLAEHGSVPLIQIQSIPFSRIFDHYVYLGSRLAAHYHPLRLIRVLLGGGRMSSIPRSYIRLRSVQNRGDAGAYREKP
ncbi:unnamed protein product [Somion occarium]|uniref:Gpi1-domain-containing protein n=1 Tax=Somion occarium TaxID=3059160 RepID=A0ABP1D8B2_9APHY